jgi:ribonuclease R
MTVETPTEQPLDADRILSYLRDTAPGPMSGTALADALELGETERDQLQELLSRLTASGALVQTRDRYGCPERMNLVAGTLRVHPDGFGFIVSDTDQDDLHVAAQRLNGAMHGDRVVGRIERARRGGRVAGSVIRILERARQQLVGTYHARGAYSFVRPVDPRLGREILVTGEADATDGHLVTLEITEHGKGTRPPAGKVIETIGDPSDPRVDVEVVIREFDLPREFPEDVLAEAAGIPTEVAPADIEGRTDFRALPIITIDGETAQDFDDAVHVEMRPNGMFRLHVHIADVSHYVKPGSAIEREALERTTSVYFVDRVLPMLPEQLSNEICSLKPQVDRLVQSVLIDIDRDGQTVNYEFHDGVIHSAARLTYREVAKILAGDDAARAEHGELVPHIDRMRELSGILIRHRRERGSIDFDLPVPEIVLNLQGETEDVVRSERNAAHRLIEEFMIRANEVVASHLVWEDVPAVYRVHEGPDSERVEALREFLSGLGHTLGGGRRPQPRDFMDLLTRVEGRPEERVVSILLLRSMKQARYQVDCERHFGLASARYTHFTSPIRRYPDLIVHRALRAERRAVEQDSAIDWQEAGLEAAAASCSLLERRAEEAERRYSAWKKLQFMADKVGETYEGHIVSVQSFGCFVELEPFFVEGLVSVSSLDDDYYRFDAAKHELRGERTGRVLKLGDRVKISVAKVDMVRRHLDFALLEGPLEMEPPPPARRRRRRGGRRKSPAADGRHKRVDSDAQPEKDAESDAQKAPVAARQAEEDAPRRRRRRGRRGGRGRSQSRQDAPDTAAAKAPDKEQETVRETAPEKSRGRDDDAKREGGDRSSKARSSKGRGDRGRGAGSRRGGRGRRPDGRSRDDGPRPAAKPVKTPDPKPAESGESGKPAVNPYLTDLDF